MSVSLIFRIAAVGILITILSQILKHKYHVISYTRNLDLNVCSSICWWFIKVEGMHEKRIEERALGEEI